MAQFLRLDQPAVYRIQFQARAQAEWSDWLPDVQVTVQAGDADHPPVTTLIGTVADQAALFGLLAQLRDLGLPLLLVKHEAAGRPCA